ncbi:beta-Ala-His dipeptidase [bacterium]|nr:beta-Ala-His dipeptidase [bacterium]
MTQVPGHFSRSPQHLWKQFYNITKIPRPSKKEEKFRVYLKSFAKEHACTYFEDAAGNILLKARASSGQESKKPILIQNHMDMVCDTLAGYSHNFETDPILTYEKDGFIFAKGTTLGADNGIGCAAALALVSDENVSHPPLELLFTSDEETGLHGALGLNTEHIEGRTMLNLDTEEWGTVYIGCAGGLNYELNKEITLEKSKFNSQDAMTVEIKVLGLLGGHSGSDIHLNRASAIKILGSLISILKDDIELVSFDGGRAHNIIPREAHCKLHVPKVKMDEIKNKIQDFYNQTNDAISRVEKNLEIEFVEDHFSSEQILSKEDIEDFLLLNMSIPSGAFSFLWEFDEPLVSYSANLARAIFLNNKLYFELSVRFTKRSEILALDKSLELLSAKTNFNLDKSGGYPSWSPDLDSKLLSKMKEQYISLFSKAPEVKAIHAGLECGILKDKIGDIDVISFGPTILNAHSPDECIEIDTVGPFWDLLTKTINSFD